MPVFVRFVAGDQSASSPRWASGTIAIRLNQADPGTRFVVPARYWRCQEDDVRRLLGGEIETRLLWSRLSAGSLCGIPSMLEVRVVP